MNTFQRMSFFTKTSMVSVAAGVIAAMVLAAANIASAPLHAQESAGDPIPARWQTSHSTVVGGETVEYDAVATGTTLTNDDGEPAAELWYTAFILRTSGGSRPVSE